ncbi:MAG: GNAT family N-acetyltransferase [Chloroflexia bacterium]
MIELLEELAGNAWPAPVQQQLEGWRLRAAGNVTRRANSVLAVGAIPEYGEWLEEVMRFYRCRGLPVRFHVSDASPEGLEGMLEGMGYLAQAHTSVQVVRCEVVLERSVGAGEFEVVGFDGLDAGWLDSFMRIEGHSESKRAMYEAILGSIGPRRRFVEARLGGEAVGVGMAVAERGWAGVFNIASDGRYRGRGIGTRVMRELALWGRENGASGMYLQVMLDNGGALALYEKLGFGHLYSYHYRVLE